MREFAIAAAVFIGIAGAVITALPVIGWFRRRRWRGSILACFRHAVDEGMIHQLKYRRDRKFVGEGWIDTYRGAAGILPFTFSVTIEPWVRLKTYRLHVVAGRDPKSGLTLREDYMVQADPGRAASEPFVLIHAELRRRVAPDGTIWPKGYAVVFDLERSPPEKYLIPHEAFDRFDDTEVS